MDFVNEQYRACLREEAVALGAVYHIAHILHPAGYGTECVERRLQLIGYNLRKRRLTHSRRAPQNERGDTSRINHLTKHSPRSHQVLLPDIFV